MYRIVQFTTADSETVFIVYDNVKGKELARYNTYHEAFLDVKGR
jgi:hypothetical protein